MSRVTYLVDHPAGTQGQSPPEPHHFFHKEHRPNTELRRRCTSVCGWHENISTELPSTQPRRARSLMGRWDCTCQQGAQVHIRQLRASSLWLPCGRWKEHPAFNILWTGDNKGLVFLHCSEVLNQRRQVAFCLLGQEIWFSVLQKMVRKVLRVRENRSSKLAAFSAGAGAARRQEQGAGGGGGFAEPQLPTSTGSSSPPCLLLWHFRGCMRGEEKGREEEGIMTGGPRRV